MADKIYTFKVSFDEKTFRVIEIRGDKSLYDFAATIVKSFDFYFDHAFGYYSNINDAYQNFFGTDEFVEFDSMINIRSSQGNRSRGVENVATQKVIRLLVDKFVRSV